MGKRTRLYFATDLHGSSKCFRKFLNAGPTYGADVLILGADLGGKNDQITASHRVRGIGMAAIDCAFVARTFENGSPVATDNAAGKSILLQREAQRAANQAGTDNGDLANGHETLDDEVPERLVVPAI